MAPNIELRQERGQIVREMGELAALNTPEAKAKWTTLDAAQEELRQRIERIEKTSNLETEGRQTGAPPSGQPGDNGADPAVAKQVLHERAFRSMLRCGRKDSDQFFHKMPEDLRTALKEYRDMGEAGLGTGAATAGGIFVPVGFQNKIEEALKYYGPMMDGGEGMPDIMTTSTGQSLPWPTDNDTTISGELIGEGQQVSTQDVTLGQITFGAYKFSSKMVKVSMELLQDSAFDLDAYLVKKFATRLGRALNTFFTTGTGSQQPTGIVTQATLAGTAVGAFSNDGASGANTIGSDDLTTLEHSVDPLYRRGARYMFHDSTLAAIKKVKDKYGRMLWVPSQSVNAPDTINGYRYAINNDMASLQTQASSPTVTNKTVLFGDLTKFTIRRVKDMSVLRLEERFADFGQVAFIAFARYDSNLLDAGTHPVKYLQNTY